MKVFWIEICIQEILPVRISSNKYPGLLSPMAWIMLCRGKNLSTPQMVLYQPTSPKGSLCSTCNIRLLKGNDLQISRLSCLPRLRVFEPCLTLSPFISCYLSAVETWEVNNTHRQTCSHTDTHMHARMEGEKGQNYVSLQTGNDSNQHKR